jgi:hypothetical protein
MRGVGTWPRHAPPQRPGVGIPKVHKPLASAEAAIGGGAAVGKALPKTLPSISNGQSDHLWRLPTSGPTHISSAIHAGLQTVGRQPFADTASEGARSSLQTPPSPARPIRQGDCRTPARYASLRCHWIALVGIGMPTTPSGNYVATATVHQIHRIRSGPRKFSAVRVGGRRDQPTFGEKLACRP